MCLFLSIVRCAELIDSDLVIVLRTQCGLDRRMVAGHPGSSGFLNCLFQRLSLNTPP